MTVQHFTEEQLSMIMSALAGDQSLCCCEQQHALTREAIARTPEQLAALATWADQHTGCRLGKGLIHPEQWKITARERYLDRVKHLEEGLQA